MKNDSFLGLNSCGKNFLILNNETSLLEGSLKKVFVGKIEVEFLFERSKIGVCRKAKNSVCTKIKSSNKTEARCSK